MTESQFQAFALVWDVKFESRQESRYRTHEKNLSQARGATSLTAFFAEGKALLDPPDHNYGTLRAFLGKVHDIDLFRESLNARPLALVDDRRDTTGHIDIHGTHHSRRDWEN
ncbi:hypothetical protein MMC11_007186 [Xylographa trunciseda]|nr:hypothetical protein [Xylographa trunciseda]